MHYCMSDLHGCKEEFLKMLERISFSEEDHLYILGDVIDRGEEPIALLKYIMAQKNITLLKGNHEEMAEYSIHYYRKEGKLENLWKYNGGDVTMEQFLRCSTQEQDEILAFLSSLPLYQKLVINNKEYLLLHAGFDQRTSMTLEERSEDELLWYRGPFFQKPYQDAVMVVGHIPTISLAPYIEKAILTENFDEENYHVTMLKDSVELGKDARVILYPHHYFIDCGLVFGHRLACLRLEDETVFYQDKL